jgi:predicted HicB family RNase H-like nuclease
MQVGVSTTCGTMAVVAPQTSPPRSGRLNVRLPVDLHTALVAEAERQGISLNTLIVSLLAGGMSWRAPD